METVKIKAQDNATLYQGNVTIKLMKGRKPYRTINVKNNGTAEFFRLLCLTVAGNNYSNLMPAYVSINNIENGITTPLSGVKPHYTTVDVTLREDVYYTEFTFIIPGSYTIPGIVNDIVLSNVNGQDLAEVRLGEDEQFDIEDTSSNIMITWILRFSNPNGGE